VVGGAEKYVSIGLYWCVMRIRPAKVVTEARPRSKWVQSLEVVVV
jgi:hypothetical protein